MSDRARLTSTQRKALRGLAHSLEPLVHVGRAGVTPSVLRAVGAALDDHELIKVKLGADRDTRAELAGAIEDACDAEIVGMIGTIAIFFRPGPDPDKRTIRIHPTGASRAT
jgi:RNA-binding protein